MQITRPVRLCRPNQRCQIHLLPYIPRPSEIVTKNFTPPPGAPVSKPAFRSVPTKLSTSPPRSRQVGSPNSERAHPPRPPPGARDVHGSQQPNTERPAKATHRLRLGFEFW